MALKGKCGRLRLCIIMSMGAVCGLFAGCGHEIQEVSPIVQVNAPGISGSGCIYEMGEENLIIVTAAHVLETTPKMVEIIFADGNSADSNSFSVSQTADVAFINVSFENISAANGEGVQRNRYQPIRADKQKFDALAGNEKMKMYGFSENGAVAVDGTLIYPWIFAEDFNQYMMLVSGEILPGMSGGALLDEEGNFAGVLCGVSENRQTAAVPLSIILAEYALIYGNG